MYMWSRTNTWSRSTERRSSSSGRSWWATVTTEACRWATCDSRAIVTLSRNRRWTRVDTVRRNHVATADTHSPKAASRTMRVVAVDDPVAEQRQPQGEQRIGHARRAARTRARPP